MGVLFKFILIIVAIYVIGKTLIRGILSWFLGDTVKKMNHQAQRQQEEMARQKKKREGQVTINYQPKSAKTFGKEEGDYVDFEEIK